MYRVLASEGTPGAAHPSQEARVDGHAQVWSWDITRLLGPKKWSYYYLYVIMDIYSRYVVGWKPGELAEPFSLTSA